MPPSSESGLVSVDPQRLAAGARPLLDLAGALHSALPAVNSAWAAASHTLANQRTGAVLGACRSPAMAHLKACAEALQTEAQALTRAALLYRETEAAAIPAQRAP